MPFPVLPVGIGLGALSLTAVGLRLRKMALDKKRGTGGVLPQAPTAGTAAFDKPVVANAANIPRPAENAPQAQKEAFAVAVQDTARKQPATPAQIALAASQAGVSVVDLDAAVRFMDPSMGAAEFVAMGPTPREITDVVFQFKQATGTLPPTPAAPEAVGAKAVVTTHDPAPDGDLIVRGSPSQSGEQIGGADKDGTVTILDARPADPTFALIRWSGGRWAACEGFAKKQFLKLV